MSALSKHEKKIQQLQNKIANKRAGKDKGTKIGPTILIATEIAAHSASALLAANYETVGPIPVRPDIALAVLSGAVALFTKKNTRKIAGAWCLGSSHAVITRLVNTKKVVLHADANGRVSLTEESIGSKPDEKAA